MPRIDAFLKLGREQDCSDIHLTIGLPPMVRLDGELIPLKYRELTRDETTTLIMEILGEDEIAQLKEGGSVDLSYNAEGVGRFRINVFQQHRGVSAVCRVIADEVPELSDLGLPSIVSRIAMVNAGLILVTGAAGTGKSTSLAAVINEINTNRNVNILTLEDPVEFLHEDKQGMVIQRELGTHVRSFSEGLRSALRQDPDVILVGEMRDLETISLALEASETGHLVLGTLHTRGAYQTIHRIVDSFPSEVHSQVRNTLAESLKCVMSQELIRVADGRGRRAVTEIMVSTPAINQMIRDGKTFQIPQAMATGRRHGMHLMDQSMLQLVQASEIDPDEAYNRATDKRDFIPFVNNPDLIAGASRTMQRPKKAG